MQWNIHHIRSNKASYSPPGKPDVLFYMPERNNTCSYLLPISVQELNILLSIACHDIADCEHSFAAIFL